MPATESVTVPVIEPKRILTSLILTVMAAVSTTVTAVFLAMKPEACAFNVRAIPVCTFIIVYEPFATVIAESRSVPPPPPVVRR